VYITSPFVFLSTGLAYGTGIFSEAAAECPREYGKSFSMTHCRGRSGATRQHITYEYSMVLETDYNPPEYWRGMSIEQIASRGRQNYPVPRIQIRPHGKKCPGSGTWSITCPEKKGPFLWETAMKMKPARPSKPSAPDRVEKLIGKKHRLPKRRHHCRQPRWSRPLIPAHAPLRVFLGPR